MRARFLMWTKEGTELVHEKEIDYPDITIKIAKSARMHSLFGDIDNRETITFKKSHFDRGEGVWIYMTDPYNL